MDNGRATTLWVECRRNSTRGRPPRFVSHLVSRCGAPRKSPAIQDAVRLAAYQRRAHHFSMTMTKAEFALTLFERIGLNKREAKELVDRFFEEIAAALEAGDFVKLSGFGNFALREKPQRPGRNPKTGQQIPILARRVVAFHPSSKLRVLIKPTTRDE